MASRALRILDFDIENRPLAYLGPEYTTAEVTAIASCWVGEPETMKCWCLGPWSLEAMLRLFKSRYDQADIVTGHYIRGHDLPTLNGAMIELGLEPLGPKMTCDTKIDLVSSRYLSLSQENLYQSLGLPEQHDKVHMSNAKWREANRLTPDGVRLTKERAVGDVQQHMVMRAELLKRGLLSSPKVWRP